MTTKQIKVSLKTKKNPNQVIAAIEKAVYKVDGYSKSLCNIKKSNIYYNGKNLQLVKISVDIDVKETPSNNSYIDDRYYDNKTVIWLKTRKTQMNENHLRQVWDLSGYYDQDENNIDIVVNGYYVRYDYAMLIFEDDEIEQIDLHLCDA